MIYHLGFFSDIGFAIQQAWRTWSCKFAAVLYNFIVDLYNVFMYVARSEFLNDDFVQNIYNRVGMILGIFMVFRLTFSLIQSLINPDTITDDKKGFAGVIKRSVISIVLLGITPSLFRMAFDLQRIIVGTENDTNNIIYKFIIADETPAQAATFGHRLATELFFHFYTPNENYDLNLGSEVVSSPDGGVIIASEDFASIQEKIEKGEEDFGFAVNYLSLIEGGEWNELFAIAVALVVIYLLIIYCIQVAARVIQLAYLQLVAPIPILSYIGSPEGTFQNWIKQCMTTYLDLFIRLAIIYFTKR